MSERGYGQVVIGDIVARAAVSKSTFYNLYETKAECLFDAHKHRSARLLAAIDLAVKTEGAAGEERRAALRAGIEFCWANLESAELLSIGILSAGPKGAERYRTTVAAIASRLAPPAATPTERARASVLAAAIFTAPLIALSLDPDEEAAPPPPISEFANSLLTLAGAD